MKNAGLVMKKRPGTKAAALLFWLKLDVMLWRMNRVN